MYKADGDILIVGAGIGGLTLALSLHQVGIPCRIFEAAPVIKPLGVGINLLPHAMRELGSLDLEPAIAARGIETRAVTFYNSFGQHIFTEPRGRFAGDDWPQYSIHRGDLQSVLLEAVRARLGPDAVKTGHRFIGAEASEDIVAARFEDPETGQALPPFSGRALVGCDGIRSAGGPGDAASGRRAPGLFRHHHVARHHALEALPRRRHHGLCRLARDRQGDLLSGS
jgi:2-polyprenyl-6-methoxyphenol hydroxylase-like FAD-dependent oxidoreductase